MHRRHMFVHQCLLNWAALPRPRGWCLCTLQTTRRCLEANRCRAVGLRLRWAPLAGSLRRCRTVCSSAAVRSSKSAHAPRAGMWRPRSRRGHRFCVQPSQSERDRQRRLQRVLPSGQGDPSAPGSTRRRPRARVTAVRSMCNRCPCCGSASRFRFRPRSRSICGAKRAGIVASRSPRSVR